MFPLPSKAGPANRVGALRSTRFRPRAATSNSYETTPMQQALNSSQTGDATALAVEGLTRSFPGVLAVDNISFQIQRNTVHCLVGENGAGKSTLIKMLTGALQPSSGNMTVNSKAYAPKSPQEARAGGIATLYQELQVVEQLTFSKI